MKEELRRAQEELQLYAKDDLTARANEIASSALRDSMLEVRSQYEADRKALASEKELRLEAEKTVEKLKSDLALLSQATEYDENVDLQVRKIAKKVCSNSLCGLRLWMAASHIENFHVIDVGRKHKKRETRDGRITFGIESAEGRAWYLPFQGARGRRKGCQCSITEIYIRARSMCSKIRYGVDGASDRR